MIAQLGVVTDYSVQGKLMRYVPPVDAAKLLNDACSDVYPVFRANKYFQNPLATYLIHNGKIRESRSIKEEDKD